MNPTPSKLRIIHYAPGMSLALGGVVRAVLDWCGILAGRGHEVILATHNEGELPSDWDGSPGKPKVVWLAPPNRPNGFVPAESVKQWEELLTSGTVAHLHVPWTASNMQMSRALRRRGIPYLVSIHGMLDDWSMEQGRLKKRMFLLAGGRRYLHAAARLHFTAAAERDQAAKWVDVRRAVVLPCLMDLSPFENLPGPALARAKFNQLCGDGPILLFLSRIHQKKGLHHLIEAAAMLCRDGRKFKLMIAGAASEQDQEYESSLRRKVLDLKLDDVVFFLGMVSGPEKISLYQAVDLFVLPTRQENLGLALVEAMAAGTPVLTTKGTDIWKEIAANGGTICDDSPAELCNSIARLLDNRPANAEAGQRGRAWVASQFNTDRLAAEYENLYARILAENLKPSSP
jgi:glycosyltransferase involved in cell wall biosynthesis